MRADSWSLSGAISDYIGLHSEPADDLVDELIAETSGLGAISGMQIARGQATLLTILTRAVSAKRAVEVGTFTGLSSLAIAKGMATGGHLLCCDVSEEWTAIARRYWERAGVSDKIELRIGPALDTLRGLPDEPSINLAFIDADKRGYVSYYEELVPRLRPGGLLLADNVLWSGRVLDDTDESEDTTAIRSFNALVKSDPRVIAAMLPVADGLTVCQRVD